MGIIKKCIIVTAICIKRSTTVRQLLETQTHSVEKVWYYLVHHTATHDVIRYKVH